MNQIHERIRQVITGHVKEYGYPPTIREIKAAVGLRSTSSVQFYVRELIEGGGLETDHPASPRALRVPGMCWIDTREYRETVRQLTNLRLHCLEMATESESSEDWKHDVEALDKVIKALDYQQ